MNDYLYAKDFTEIPAAQYKIHSMIGRGAFSRVYLAYTPDYYKVAIKRLRLTQKPQSLLREIDFLRKMTGKPNIVQLRQLIFSERTLQTSFVTSYLQDSADFKQSLYSFTPENVYAYARSLLTALSHLEPNILHRDIKPGNFLFSLRTNRGILIDFGLAQSLSEAYGFSKHGAPHSSICRDSQRLFAESCFPSVVEKSSQKTALPNQPHAGTHGYRAPEILLYVNSYDCKIDVYGCGVCLLQILLGKSQLFRDQPNYDVYELLAQRNFSGAERFICALGRMHADFYITSGAPQPSAQFLEKLAFDCNPGLLLGLNFEFFSLLRRLLEFDPARRISASEALCHAYFATTARDSLAFSNAFYRSAVSFLETYKLTYEAAELLGARMRDILKICGDDYAAETFLREYENSNYAQIALSQNIRRGAEKLSVRYKIAPYIAESLHGALIQRKNAKCVFSNSNFQASPGRHARHSQSAKDINAYMKEHETAQLRAQLSAYRRKIDTHVTLLKAMNREVLAHQRKLRYIAEEFRREVAKALELVPDPIVEVPNEDPRESCAKSPPLGAFNAHIVDNICVNVFEDARPETHYIVEASCKNTVELVGQFLHCVQQAPGGQRAYQNDFRIVCALRRQRQLQFANQNLTYYLLEARESLAFSDRKFTFYSARFGDLGYYKQVYDIKEALDALNAEIYAKYNRIKAFECYYAMIAEDLAATRFQLLILRGERFVPQETPRLRVRARDVSDDVSEHVDSLNSRLLSLNDDEQLYHADEPQEEFVPGSLDAYQYGSFSDSASVPSKRRAFSHAATAERLPLKGSCVSNKASFMRAYEECANEAKTEKIAPPRVDFDTTLLGHSRACPSAALVRFQQHRTAQFLCRLCFSQFHALQLAQILQMKYSAASGLGLTLYEIQTIEKYYRSGLARKDAILTLSACQNRFDAVMERPPDLAHLLRVSLVVTPRRRSQSFMPGVPKSLAMRRFLGSDPAKPTTAQKTIYKRVEGIVNALTATEQRPIAALEGYPERQVQNIAPKCSAEDLKRINSFVLHPTRQNQFANQIGCRMIYCLSQKASPALADAMQRGIDQFGGDLAYTVVYKVVQERRLWRHK